MRQRQQWSLLPSARRPRATDRLPTGSYGRGCRLRASDGRHALEDAAHNHLGPPVGSAVCQLLLEISIVRGDIVLGDELSLRGPELDDLDRHRGMRRRHQRCALGSARRGDDGLLVAGIGRVGLELDRQAPPRARRLDGDLVALRLEHEMIAVELARERACRRASGDDAVSEFDWALVVVGGAG